MSGTRRVKLGRKLRFNPELIREIARGRKTCTVRLGIVEPTSRTVVLYCRGRPVAVAEIEYVRYMKVRELGEGIARLDGFSSREELLEELTKIYPYLTPDDWVTVIKFRIIRWIRRPRVR